VPLVVVCVCFDTYVDSLSPAVPLPAVSHAVDVVNVSVNSSSF
jgi:hypothetical protein